MSTDISKRERMTLLGAALGCKEPAPEFLGWLEEYVQKQQVSSNKFGAGLTPHVQESGTGSGCTERAMTPAPIHLGPNAVSAWERAQLFRETTKALLPEFAYLIVSEPGNSNCIPHDCIEELDVELRCTICKRQYTKETKGIHLVERTAR